MSSESSESSGAEWHPILQGPIRRLKEARETLARAEIVAEIVSPPGADRNA